LPESYVVQREAEPTEATVTPAPAIEKPVTRTDADPQSRKESAAAAVESQLTAAKTGGLGTVIAALEQAEQAFGVTTSVRVDENGKLQLGYQASPWLYVYHLYPVGNTFSDILIGAGSVPVSYLSRWYRWIAGTFAPPNVRYGPLTGAGFGTFMESDPVGQGGGSKPTVSNATWDILLKRRVPGGSASYYVRGHLLNDNIGGPGDTWSNLTPLTSSANNNAHQSHLRLVETDVKAKVNAGHTMGYRVEPTYGRWAWEMPRILTNIIYYGLDAELAEVIAAEDHVPTGLVCTYWEYALTLGYVPTVRYIRQWANRNLDSYRLKRSTGATVDFGAYDMYDMLQVGLNASLAYLLIPLVPPLAGVAGALLPDVAGALLSAAAAYSGLSVAQFLFQQHYALGAIAALIGGYLSSGKIRYPVERLGRLNL